MLSFVKIIFDDICYDSKTDLSDLENTPFEFAYKPLGWVIQLSYKGVPYDGRYTL